MKTTSAHSMGKDRIGEEGWLSRIFCILHQSLALALYSFRSFTQILPDEEAISNRPVDT